MRAIINVLLLILSENIGTGRGCEQTGAGRSDTGNITLTSPAKLTQADNKTQADGLLSGAHSGKAVVSLKTADSADIA